MIKEKDIINIDTGTIEDILYVIDKIPEYTVRFNKQDIETKLYNQKYIILIASINNKPAGYLVALENKYNKWFEIWIAGVDYNYRKIGIMTSLNDKLEQHSKSLGYRKIIVDINQRNLEMLIFELRRGYFISGYKFDNKIETSKIFLEKNFY